MKLTTKIAGSMALPLALAVAANSAQAFTVVDNDEHTITIGGYLSAITSWDKAGSKTSRPTERKFNNEFSAGTSRLNLGYTDKATGTKFFYEQQFVSNGQTNGLRHAYFETADGLVGGHTWSFGTNNVARIETIEITNNSLVTDQHYGSRTLLLGQRFTVADGMKVGVSLEDQNNTVSVTNTNNVAKPASKSVLPGVTVNFDGQFGDARVFAAWTNYAVNTKALTPTDSGKDKRTNRITLGTSIDAGAANIKLGLTHNFGVKQGGAQVLNDMGNAKGTHVSGALGFKVNEKVRTNLAFEYSEWDKDSGIVNKKNKDGDASRVWLNAFYQADNGIEWGAEYQYADIDASNVEYKSLDKTLYDNGQAIRLQAKYAF